jgi:plastocyanin
MSQEAPSRPDLTGEFRVRFPLPVVLPLVAVTVIAVLAFGFARVLLSIPKEAATAVALVTAANILIACAFVALRSRMHRVGVLEVALIALYPIVVALVIGYTGIGTEAAAEAEGEAAQVEEGAVSGAGSDVTLVAQNVAFDSDAITLPAEEDVTLTLDNQDSLPHNLSLYETEADADGQDEALFQGDNVDGGASIDYEFAAPPPGEYVFQCDIHPAMRGRATAE